MTERKAGRRKFLEGAYNLETPADNRQFYAGWAATYESDFTRPRGYAVPAEAAAAYRANAKPEDGLVLDVGCGTGLVAEAMPDYVIDGLDITPEMLEIARAKGLYRRLIQADITKPLPLTTGAYAGVICTGTFSRGHVGPAALDELVRVAARGAIIVITINVKFYQSSDFETKFATLAEDGWITAPDLAEVAMYHSPDPDDPYGADTCFVTLFQRL